MLLPKYSNRVYACFKLYFNLSHYFYGYQPKGTSIFLSYPNRTVYWFSLMAGTQEKKLPPSGWYPLIYLIIHYDPLISPLALYWFPTLANHWIPALIQHLKKLLALHWQSIGTQHWHTIG